MSLRPADAWSDMLRWTDAVGLAQLVRERKLSPLELVDAAIERLTALEPQLQCLASASFDRARTQAAGDLPPGPFRGVPFLLKDAVQHSEGDPYRHGLGALASSEWRAPHDSELARRYRAAGFVLLGRTKVPELTMSSTTEPLAYGPAHNPWSLTHSPGGSSGGSAAAVAARLVPAALGSDTGGSVRQPAGFCGCVGVRPTWGRVSRSGLMAFASSLDQVGPIALTVRDAAVMLQAIAGPDANDATTIASPAPDWTAALSGDVRGCRVGVPWHLFDAGLDDDVRASVRAAIDTIRARGAQVADVTLTHASLAIPVYYLIATAEASSNLARYDGVRYGFRAPEAADLRDMYERTRRDGFGAEVKRRIILGTFVLSAGYRDAYYVKAQRVRTLIARDLDAALQTADVLVLPTSPTPAFALGERTADPLSMYLSDVFTVGASLAGLPALSLPCGFSRAGLPIGVQVVGRRGDEATMLRVADAVEEDLSVWQRAPSGARDDSRRS